MKYEVMWYAPRNFANEGYYFFGSQSDIQNLFEKLDDADCGLSSISNHRTLEAAENAANRKMKEQHTSYRRQQMDCSIGVESASEELDSIRRRRLEFSELISENHRAREALK